MGDRYIPLSEAAARSGLHPNTLQRLLREGKLIGRKERFGQTWRWAISVRSLDKYANPWNGFLMDRPGPKLYLQRRDKKRKPRPPKRKP